jgi:hypothetical protein
MLKRQQAEDSMGATNKSALRVTFDSRVKLEFHGSKVTSDAGLLAYRELDEALELTARSGGLLDDWHTGKNTQHSLVALLRQMIFQMAEVAIPRELFRAILEGIGRVRWPTPLAG